MLAHHPIRLACPPRRSGRRRRAPGRPGDAPGGNALADGRPHRPRAAVPPPARRHRLRRPGRHRAQRIHGRRDAPLPGARRRSPGRRRAGLRLRQPAHDAPPPRPRHGADGFHGHGRGRPPRAGRAPPALAPRSRRLPGHAPPAAPPERRARPGGRGGRRPGGADPAGVGRPRGRPAHLAPHHRGGRAGRRQARPRRKRARAATRACGTWE